jgi:signal transduction histidine kinase/CheY-like chemotaxis protein
MSDLKASNTERSGTPPDTHLKGLLWEARADNGEVTLFAGEVESILGPQAESQRPRFSGDLFHPEDRERVAGLLARVAATGESAIFDARVISSSNNPLWLRSAIRTIKRESGLYLRGVSFDISALKLAQSEFLRARARLSFLTGMSRILAESLDYETTLKNVARSAVPEIADWCAVRIIANDGTMERLADVHSDPSREKILDEIVRRFPPTEDFGPHKVIREGIAQFLPDTSGPAERVGSDDEHRALLHRIGFASYLCVPLRGREHILGIISMAITDSGRHFTDADFELAEVTAARATMAIENARMFRDARDELQRREIFIAQLGHELRNPLSAIANAMAVLDSASPDPVRAARLHDILKRQTTQLSRLVDDLLDVSRISQGKISLNRAPFNIAVLVARSVQTLQETGGLEGRNIDLQVHSRELTINADEVRVEQIIWNLLLNAIKFTEPGGSIEVAVSRVDDSAVVSVLDDGAGISPRELPDIFQPFHQAAANSVEAGGMGLGLALVEQLTRLHGGSIAVTSGGPGAGSRFEVKLPLADEVVAGKRDRVHDGDSNGVNTNDSATIARRVLIVDDNLDALESLKLLLELAGHEIAVASDGESGIEQVASWHPEVALIDIGLPDIDGYEVAARLRVMESPARPLLVALTGYGQPEDRRRALSAGFDVHLTKPVDIDELNRILSWQGPREG